MAVALDADQEQLVHFSFPIEKQEETATINPVDGTPDILIWGKATDGTIDADRQIVDPGWSAAALKRWVATNGNVRMAHDPKRPVGKGQDVQVTMDGHYVKSLICDPLAKHFVRTGVLSDYSVGISNPHIKYGPDKALDPRGAASGGIITGRPDGLTEIAELSVVDRGSNFNSRFQIVRKSAGGDAEFVGKMVGDEDEITKAAPADLLTKAVAPAPPAGIDTWTAPEDLSITFTPNDMARMLQQKFVDKHYAELAQQAAVEKRDFDRGVGGGVDRDKLPDSDFAGPHRSFPIVTQSDVSDALGLAGHADDPGAVRARIHAIARRKGFSVPDDDSKQDKGTGEVAEQAVETAEAVKEAEPDVIKDPEPEPETEPKDRPVKKAKKKGKKLPPWLNKPSDGDDDGDSDDDDDKAEKAYCGLEHEHTEKCHTDPAQAAGVSASPMSPAPVKELLETPAPSHMKSGPTPASASGASEAAPMQPVPAHREPDGAPMEAFEKDAKMSDGDDEGPTRLEAAAMKAVPDLAPSPEVAAILRFRRAGIDDEYGRLHDLTCPAYHPDEVAKYHPFASFSQIDVGSFQRKAVRAAAGRDIASAMAASEAWHAAEALKGADPAWLNDCRLMAWKAFRDANPGPSSYPTPGSVSPQRYCRPVVTEGHAANSPGYGSPNTSPQVATSAPNANSFDRPPLASGHQSPSPSHMKWSSGQYPDRQGVPTQISYQHMEKDQARMALVRMHEQISRQFPEVCPLDSPDARPLRGQQPEHKPVPPIAGIGKSEDAIEANLTHGETIIPKSLVPAVAASFKAEPEQGGQFGEAAIWKGMKKKRKKLARQVLDGSMTVDEARSRLGRTFAQKQAERAIAGGEEAAVQKSAGYTPQHGPSEPEVAPAGRASAAPAAPPAPVAASFDPEVVKAAVAEATTELKDLLVKQQETFTAKLAEQQKVIDAIADQPDPSTAAFSGVALNPVRKAAARPAGVTEIAEGAERAQQAMVRELRNQYNSASDPAAREAAYAVLCKMQGVGP